MTKVNSILAQRTKKSSDTSKMSAMAKQSVSGNLTSFSGVFSVVELSHKEKEALTTILKNHANEAQDIGHDLNLLISLTSEVKAINNQAALLHGERIKKAHQILIHYRDGAFTSWLIAVYGNRQTPYNLMQYYEFCEAMPKQLRPQIELMPRQAVYVLASRAGTLDKKKALIEKYNGETKAEMLALIRQTFPLEQGDKRQQKTGKILIHNLQRICQKLEQGAFTLTNFHKKQSFLLLEHIQKLIGDL